jgi:hypothetical protein
MIEGVGGTGWKASRDELVPVWVALPITFAVD